MIKILFVCHGNICRSPMAEYVMKHLVARRGRGAEFFIDSAATSTEEIGHGVHRGTRQRLAQAGVPCGDHRARRITREDYGRFDLLVGMDRANLRSMLRILGDDPKGKVRLLLPGREVDDPWYTGDFDATYADVLEGCEGLLEDLGDQLS